MTNLSGQEPWELRGANDARIQKVTTDLAALDGQVDDLAGFVDARLDIVEAKLALINAGAWTAFTPTFVGVTTTSGTNVGYYVRIGRSITYRGSFVLGASSAISGFVYINLPVAARDTSWVGSFYANNNGHNSGTLVANSVNDAFPVVGTVHVGTSTPATWTTGEYFIWDVTYEAAS